MTEPNSPIRKYRNVGHAGMCIVREEGITALYKGVLPTVLRQASNQAVNFTGKIVIADLIYIQNVAISCLTVLIVHRGYKFSDPHLTQMLVNIIIVFFCNILKHTHKCNTLIKFNMQYMIR